jgi:hypothetical protein
MKKVRVVVHATDETSSGTYNPPPAAARSAFDVTESNHMRN